MSSHDAAPPEPGRGFADLDEVVAAAGQHVGTSPWMEVTQDRIDTFAAATGDHQWIHVDPERARTGPYGATVAHGYLTLSLLPVLGASAYTVGPGVTRVNYGMNRVRFPHPVRVGSRVRAVVSFGDVTPVGVGLQLVQRFVVEIEGVDKPACVAETVVLLRG
jgi:acyl dehydratase